MKITDWRDFAKVTIETNDLDPSYVFLYNIKKDKGDDWARRFVVHYLMFYDLGEALMAAEATDNDSFWDYVILYYPIFHRGTERRHFRGENGMKCVLNLKDVGTPAQIWRAMTAPTYTRLTDVFANTFHHCGFGPYFIWKVLDFQERVWGEKITLSLEEVVRWCPDEPRRCAAIIWPVLPFHKSVQIVTDYISQFQAPPGYDRPCSYQEAETILCMIKGYFITKTHTIGDDIDSKYKQLAKWPELTKYLPPKLDWEQYERHPLEPAPVSGG
jgi:hypothetical protein